MFELTDVYYINSILIILPSRCFPLKNFLRSSKLWSNILDKTKKCICLTKEVVGRNSITYLGLTKFLPSMTSISLNYINSFWLFRKCTKTCFFLKKMHRYLNNGYQFFDTLKTKGRKIRGNCNLLIKVNFHELEWSSPLNKCSCRSFLKYLFSNGNTVTDHLYDDLSKLDNFS